MPVQRETTLEISSASKRPETVADIPASVTVITRRDLERMGWPTLEEVLRNVPGLYLVDKYTDLLIGVRGGIGGGNPSMTKGYVRELRGLHVAVLDADQRGATRVRFKFEKPRTDGAHRFLAWREGSLESVDIPPVGGSILVN